MAKITLVGATELMQKFARMRRESRALDNVACVVGYTAKYSLAVHEDLATFHAQGQAKYLEAPARLLRPVIADIVLKAKLRGLTTGQCLLLAGLKLQRESQLLVPVDTGFLRGSAFTKLERYG